MNTLMKHQRLLNVWGIQFKKNFTVNNTLTEAMFEHELVPAVSSAHGDEVPITGLDEFNWELKVDKWVEEIDFMNLASRKRQVTSQPLLIASCLELIALHIDSLEGKPVSVLESNPGDSLLSSATPRSRAALKRLQTLWRSLANWWESGSSWPWSSKTRRAGWFVSIDDRPCRLSCNKINTQM